MNIAILMGRLTAEPELRRTQSGKDVLSFCLAVDRGYGEKKETDFINCVAWEHTARFVSQYFRKGSLIAVNGSIRTRKYEDKYGNSRIATEVLVDHAFFTGDFTGEKSGRVTADVYRDDFAPAPMPTYNITSYAAQPAPQPPQLFFSDFAELQGGDDDLPF